MRELLQLAQDPISLETPVGGTFIKLYTTVLLFSTWFRSPVMFLSFLLLAADSFG